MPSRGEVTSKWHRVCINCGTLHHINAIKTMDGNECCPGYGFTRDKTKLSVENPQEDTHV